MEHNEHPELDLENILKEFSEDPELEEILREFAPEPKVPSAPPSGDTVRLDGLAGAVSRRPSADMTQRFEAVASGEPAEPEPPAPTPAPAPAIEPFSEEWEPEYEEPMGNYTPQQPIVFPEKDRLRKLREQLVQHAEHRYYDLVQAGFARLRLSGLIIFLIFLISAGTTWALDLGFIGANRTKLVAFCQLLSILLTALLCHSRLLEGAMSLLRGRFTLKSFLGITFVVCCADALMCLSQERVSCCSIFCLQAAAVQWSTRYARQREILQMDTLRKASELNALVKIEDYHDGLPGYVSTDGELEDFWDHFREIVGPERALNIFSAISLGVSTILAVVSGLRSGFAAGLQVMTAMLLVTLPATAFISMRLPELLLEKRLHTLGTVLCGWQGMKAVEKHVAVPITHGDLFPRDAIGMNGMKFYGELDPDMVLCYAGSLIAYEGGSLTGIFNGLMATRYIRHAPVEEFGSFPGGLSALVDGEPVAVGILEFMRQLDVEIPKEAQIPHAVYVAVDGRLSGVFALRCNRSKPAASGLRNLCSYGRLTPLMVSRDFLLTGKFLREKLKVNVRRLVFPDGDTRDALSGQTPEEGAPVVALTVRKGLPQRAFAITGTWALKAAQKGGAIIHIISGSLGLAAVAVLVLIGATNLLTPINLLVYSLIWMLPGCLISQWTRYI